MAKNGTNGHAKRRGTSGDVAYDAMVHATNEAGYIARRAHTDMRWQINELADSLLNDHPNQEQVLAAILEGTAARVMQLFRERERREKEEARRKEGSSK